MVNLLEDIIPVSKFTRNPRKYFDHLDEGGNVILTVNGKISYVLETAKRHVELTEGYLAWRKSQGDISPELEAIMQQTPETHPENFEKIPGLKGCDED